MDDYGIDPTNEDFSLSFTNKDEKEVYQEKAYKYIYNLRNDLKSLISQTKSIQVLEFIHKNSQQGQILNLIEVGIEKYDFVEIMIQLTEYQYLCLVDSLKNKIGTTNNDATAIDSLKNLKNSIKIQFKISRNFTNRSSLYRFKMCQLKGVDIILKYLKDEQILNQCITDCAIASNTNNSSNYYLSDILRSGCGTLINLTQCIDSFKNDWHSNGAASTLINYSEVLKEISDHKIAAYLVLANISDEKMIDELPMLQNVAEIIAHLLKDSSQSFHNKKK
jgi:hypothetical protein